MFLVSDSYCRLQIFECILSVTVTVVCNHLNVLVIKYLLIPGLLFWLYLLYVLSLIFVLFAPYVRFHSFSKVWVTE